MSVEFITNVYNVMFDEIEDFSLDSLDPKNENYGEDLCCAVSETHREIYSHINHKNEVDTVAYIQDFELTEDNIIVIKLTYWVKYGTLKVYKSDDTHTGWNKRITNHGMPITFEIRIDGDQEHSTINIDIFNQGYSNNIILECDHLEKYYYNSNGNRCSYFSYLNDTDDIMSSYNNISNSIKYVIQNMINYLFDTIVEVSYNMSDLY